MLLRYHDTVRTYISYRTNNTNHIVCVCVRAREKVVEQRVVEVKPYWWQDPTVHPGDETFCCFHSSPPMQHTENKKCTKTLNDNDDDDDDNDIVHHARIVSVSVRFNNKLKKFPLLVLPREKKEKAKKPYSYN